MYILESIGQKVMLFSRTGYMGSRIINKCFKILQTLTPLGLSVVDVSQSSE